jgi:hypothetical protein
LAIGSLIAFVVLLCGVSLLVLRPWDGNSLGPQLRVGSDIGIGLDDLVAVAGGGPAVAEARVAGGGRAAVVANRGGAVAGAVPAIGISSNRPAIVPAPSPAQPPGPAAHAPETVAVPVQPGPAPPSADAPVPTNSQPVVAGGQRRPAGGGNFGPTLSGLLRDGDAARVLRLTGDQDGSLLILAGDDGAPLQIREGEEYAFEFSFYLQTMVYGEPGADNLIMRFQSEGSESSSFGLQLWDYPGDGWYLPSAARGLWASGEAMGGDRFLAPVEERVWHDLVVRFTASSEGSGSYEVLLDGQPIDARSGVSLIAPGSDHAEIAVGLLRDGGRVQGTSEIRIDSAKLGAALLPAVP